MLGIKLQKILLIFLILSQNVLNIQKTTPVTPYSDGSINQLTSHFVNCGPNSGLTSYQLLHDGNGGIYYSYNCSTSSAIAFTSTVHHWGRTTDYYVNFGVTPNLSDLLMAIYKTRMHCNDNYFLNGFQFVLNGNYYYFNYYCVYVPNSFTNIQYCEPKIFGIVPDHNGDNIRRTQALINMGLVGYNDDETVIKSIKISVMPIYSPWRVYQVLTICYSKNYTDKTDFTSGPVDYGDGDIRQLSALVVYCWNAILSNIKFNLDTSTNNISYTYRCTKNGWVASVGEYERNSNTVSFGDTVYNNKLSVLTDENNTRAFSCGENYGISSFNLFWIWDSNYVYYEYRCYTLNNNGMICKSHTFGFANSLMCGGTTNTLYKTCPMADLPLAGFNSSDYVISSLQLLKDGLTPKRYYFRMIICQKSTVTDDPIYQTAKVPSTNPLITQLQVLHVYCYAGVVGYIQLKYESDTDLLYYEYKCIRNKDNSGISTSNWGGTNSNPSTFSGNSLQTFLGSGHGVANFLCPEGYGLKLFYLSMNSGSYYNYFYDCTPITGSRLCKIEYYPFASNVSSLSPMYNYGMIGYNSSPKKIIQSMNLNYSYMLNQFYYNAVICDYDATTSVVPIVPTALAYSTLTVGFSGGDMRTLTDLIIYCGGSALQNFQFKLNETDNSIKYDYNCLFGSQLVNISTSYNNLATSSVSFTQGFNNDRFIYYAYENQEMLCPDGYIINAFYVQNSFWGSYYFIFKYTCIKMNAISYCELKLQAKFTNAKYGDYWKNTGALATMGMIGVTDLNQALNILHLRFTPGLTSDPAYYHHYVVGICYYNQAFPVSQSTDPVPYQAGYIVNLSLLVFMCHFYNPTGMAKGGAIKKFRFTHDLTADTLQIDYKCDASTWLLTNNAENVYTTESGTWSDMRSIEKFHGFCPDNWVMTRFNIIDASNWSDKVTYKVKYRCMKTTPTNCVTSISKCIVLGNTYGELKTLTLLEDIGTNDSDKVLNGFFWKMYLDGSIYNLCLTTVLCSNTLLRPHYNQIQNTGSVPVLGGDIYQLLFLYVNCAGNSAIANFTFKYDIYTQKISIDYKCVSNIYIGTQNQYTEFSRSYTTSTYYFTTSIYDSTRSLGIYNVSCPLPYVLKSFRFFRIPGSSSNNIRINYTCVYITYKSCYTSTWTETPTCNYTVNGLYSTQGLANCGTVVGQQDFNSVLTGFVFTNDRWRYMYCLLRTCDISCNGCSTENSNTSCTTCATGYFLLSGACVSTDGYYYNTTTSAWVACYNLCATCTQAGTSDAHNCLTCKVGYYNTPDNLTTCINTLPIYYYLNVAMNMYRPCYSSCLTCTYDGTPTVPSCTTCKENYYPKSNDLTFCTNTTPENYWFSNSIPPGETVAVVQYRPCYTGCKVCTDDGTAENQSCTECKSDYFTDPNNSNNCILKNGNWFNGVSTQWEPCHTSCLTCSAAGTDDATNCTTCKTNSNYYPKSDQPSNCFNSTPPSYWLYSVTVAPPIQIPVLPDPRYPPTPVIAATSTVITNYRPCHTNCATCSSDGTDSSNNCSSCKSGYYPRSDYISTQCYNTAPQYYYLNLTTGQYKPCYTGCNTCSADADTSHNCLTCKSGYYPKSDLLTDCWNTLPTYYYFNSSTSQYKPCYSSCQTCSGDGTDASMRCTVCRAGFYSKSDNTAQCYNTVPLNYYFNSGTSRYTPCYSVCLTCSTTGTSTTNNCLSCIDGYYSKSDSPYMCYNTVPQYYYFNTVANQYRPCYMSCGTCTADGQASAHNCVTCRSGYYPRSDAPSFCYASGTVMIYYYFNSSLIQYRPCYPSCLYCTADGTDSNHMCSTCASGYLPLSNNPSKCYAVQPAGYFGNGPVWSPCYSTCLTCSGGPGTSTNNLCTLCVAGYYPIVTNMANCINATPSGFYLNTAIASSMYDFCYSSCKTCNGVGTNEAHNCIQCNVGYYPKSDNLSLCYNATPLYYYLNIESGQYRPCGSSCTTCSADSSAISHNCLTCRTGYYPRNDLNTSCYNSAPGNYWLNPAFQQWFPCYQNCATCTVLGTPINHFCDLCKTGMYKLVDKPTFCYPPPCIDGYWYDSFNSICAKCDVSCATCTGSPTFCTKCAYDKVYYPLWDNINKCVFDCPDRYWKDNVTKTCQPCHESCYNCLDPTMNCVKCNTNYLRIEGTLKCTLKCPTGLITNLPEMLCQPCIPPCKTCSIERTRCESCITGFKLVVGNFTCASECDPNYYQEQLFCKKCLSPCDNCMNAKDCLTCLKGFIKEEDTTACVAKCKPNYFADVKTNMCYKCGPLCGTCENKKTCLSCSAGLVLMDDTKTCVTKCPDGFYQSVVANIPTCLACDDNCLTCADSSTNCITCKPGIYFLPADPKKVFCMPKCPDGFFGNSQTLTCIKCDERCKTCKAPTKADCVDCSDKFPYYRNGICTDSCADDEVKIDSGCSPVAKCFDNIDINAPTKFAIDTEDFITQVKILLKETCGGSSPTSPVYLAIMQGIAVQWENTFGGKLENNGMSLKLPFPSLENGAKTFDLTVQYKGGIIAKISKTVLFKKNRLVSVVKNDNKMDFMYGIPILIDAGLSYDEGMLDSAVGGVIVDPDLKFTWICPDKINTFCSSVTAKTLKMEKKDYAALVPIGGKGFKGQINLQLSKDKRTTVKILNITINGGEAAPAASGSPGIGTSAATPSGAGDTAPPVIVKVDLSIYIQIDPLSRGVKNEDYMFGIIFLSEDYKVKDFTYKWTLNEINDATIYLNGRIDPVIKIKNDAIQKGDNSIVLEFTDKSGNKYNKIYVFQRSVPPMGGTCTVTPAKGFSLITEFTFETVDWITDKGPLMYKFYTRNAKGNFVALTDDFQALGKFITKIVPSGNQFYADVIDSSGMVGTTACSLDNQVDPNTNIDFAKLDAETMNIKQKLLIKEAMTAMNIPLDNKMAGDSLNLMEKMISDNPKEAVKKNADILLSQLNTITLSASANRRRQRILSEAPSAADIDIQAKADKTLGTLIDNMASFTGDSEKVTGLFSVISNSASNPDQVTEQGTEKYDNLLEKISDNVFSNMIAGQGMNFATSTFHNVVAKISETSKEDFSIPPDDEEVVPGRARFRHLTSSGAGASIFNLNKTELDEAGVTGMNVKVNKNNDNIPITAPSFSDNSMKFGGYNENGERRLFSLPGVKLNYRVFLKVSGLNNTQRLNASACIQYNPKLQADFTACQTWYDYEYFQVMCLCKKAQLTINILDDELANGSKSSQFDFNQQNIFNPIACTIVGILILILLVLLIIAYYKDKQDELYLKYMESKHFDLMQHYIIKYTKEGFHEQYTFWQLFIYNVKTTHPILSIINIGSAYRRSLRVLDFFLHLYLTFFLSMAPFVLNQNSKLIENMTKRDLKDFGKDIDGIGFDPLQMVWGLIYSILGSILTTIITMGLKAIMFSDVIRAESFKREALMKSFCRIYLFNGIPEYQWKIKSAKMKMKAVLILLSLKKNQSEISNHSEGDEKLLLVNNSPMKLYDIEMKTLNNNPGKALKSDYNLLFGENEVADLNVSLNSNWLNPNYLENCREMDFFILSKTNVDGNNLQKNKNLIENFFFKKRAFTFKKEIKTDQIECTNMSILKIQKPQLTGKSVFLKVTLKQIIITVLFMVLWFFLLIFIREIYNKYGQNFVKICVMPLVSMLVISLVITANIMILIATIAMWYYGKQIYSIHQFSIKKIIYGALVPITAINHHQSILAFRFAIEKMKNLN